MRRYLLSSQTGLDRSFPDNLTNSIVSKPSSSSTHKQRPSGTILNQILESLEQWLLKVKPSRSSSFTVPDVVIHTIALTFEVDVGDV